MKIYTNELGHMTWPPCPYMVKTLKGLLQNHKTDDLDFVCSIICASTTKVVKINTHFMPRSNLVTWLLYGKRENYLFFWKLLQP